MFRGHEHLENAAGILNLFTGSTESRSTVTARRTREKRRPRRKGLPLDFPVAEAQEVRRETPIIPLDTPIIRATVHMC